MCRADLVIPDYKLDACQMFVNLIYQLSMTMCNCNTIPDQTPLKQIYHCKNRLCYTRARCCQVNLVKAFGVGVKWYSCLTTKYNSFIILTLYSSQFLSDCG